MQPTGTSDTYGESRQGGLSQKYEGTSGTGAYADPDVGG